MATSTFFQYLSGTEPKANEWKNGRYNVGERFEPPC